ncbi:MAG TPA: tetratricopeptide repeat protein [Acidimicrobiales bacterium]|nr:tetratricopeptide repeat protein [Acidimicrobiales bacterium]
MRERAHAYVPIDRRLALARGVELPTGVWGSALEADLSGFTALTETLARRLGEQRGAEELSARLNHMYDGLIHEVHRFGGTVLGFSGDAFTCWLDDDDGMRAVACAQSLERWMDDHAAELSGHEAPPKLKVAVATGSTRRFLVGDPAVQLIEGLAGSLVDDMAAVEHEALPGDVVLASSTRASLGSRVATGERGVLIRSIGAVAEHPWPALAEDPENIDAVSPWLLPPVRSRLSAGLGDFLAELRPATALFLRFLGIGFETDPKALERLDTFVRAVQGVLTDYEGTLIQLTIGDKGSYLYAAFGAPVAHEDDSSRALLAALGLRRLSGRGKLVQPVSIGVAAGRLRAGAYGGAERRTYGVLGDTVNLSARLMQAAAPGEIIATQAVREATGGGFTWADMAPLTVKGKSLPVAVAKLRAVQANSATSRHARPQRQAPMLGRQAELAQLEASLDLSIAGGGQIVGVVAEAGMGKTRLVIELLRAATTRNVAVHQGECPSFGMQGSYVVWRPIWHSLLGLSARRSTRAKVEAAAAQLAGANPALLHRLPLVSPLLGLPIPDNDLTRSLDGKARKTSLESLLADWLRATADRPRLLLLEDCHWIDSLSEDLLEALGRAIRELPVLVVVTSRPRSETEGGELAVMKQAHYGAVPLGPLADDDVDSLVARRLAGVPLPKGVGPLAAQLAQRAEGNPFYVEELLDYLLELGPEALDQDRLAEMPTNLQSLILSRIDRLAERPRSTLKVASAIGRVFDADRLAPVQPQLGSATVVLQHLDVLQRSDFVLPEAVATHLYAFRHAVTQEVAYSTIAGDTRAALHGRIGRLIEQLTGEEPDRHLDLLAHHFARSDDDARRRRYVLQAGEAAQARYANKAAIEYFSNVLALLEGPERGEVLLKLGRSLVLTGRWDAATAAFQEALQLAVARGDPIAQAWAETEIGELLRKQGRYVEAAAEFDEARTKLESAGDLSGVAEVLHLAGTLAAQQGDTTLARGRYEQSLAMRQDLDDRRGMARSLNGLGIVAEYENQLAHAADFYQRSLKILTDLGDTWGVAAVTNNAGYALLLEGRPADARPFFEQAVALEREVGDPAMLANFLSNLGDAARELGDPDTAMRCYDESLVLSRELGERWLVTYLLEDVALLCAQEDLPQQAVLLAAAGARLRQEIGAPLPTESQKKLDARLAPARAALSAAAVAAWAQRGATLTFDEAVEEALRARAVNVGAGG